MTLTNLKPPEIRADMLRGFVKSVHGIDGTWSRLDGERDQNFRLVEASGAAWVFKVCNPHEAAEIILCQAGALEHIAQTDPALPVPRLRRARDGSAAPILADSAGNPHLTLMLSWLPGAIVGERALPAEQLKSVGALVARLGRALRGFIHAAPAARRLVWDNRLAPQLLDSADLLPTGHRQPARRMLESFRERTVPKLAPLRSQIIHGDIHPYNTLLAADGTISGLIDFGDLVHAPLIQDLSNVIADYLMPGCGNEAIIEALVRGYCSITRLEEEELDVLPDMIEMRLLMTPVIESIRAAEGIAAQGYLAQFGGRSFPLLAELQERRDALQNLIRRAGAYPPKRAAASPAPVADLLERRRRVMGNRLYVFYDPPVHMVRGEGVWLFDADGRRYLDCYNNVPHVGHCHPYVTEALVRQARRLNTNTRYVTDEAIEYAERLTATLDKSLSAVVYVNSGSEANDVAWRMAKAWTSKQGGLAMDFAYHGITEAIDAFSPSNAAGEWNAPHIRLLPPPDDYRGPFKRGEAGIAAKYAGLADAPIASLQEAGYGLAAAMIDSAFMTNGMLDVATGYLQLVCEKIHAAGGLFIADEVQSGFGRMGSAMWGHQHHGVVPDFVTIGKPAGNGHPLGVVVTRPEILDHFTKSTAFFSTFGGNNVSCAAGIAVLDVIRDEGLIDNAHRTGALLMRGLQDLMGKHELIGDVRGVGLAVGMELVLDRKTLEPAAKEAAKLLSLIRDEGVLVGGEGKLGNIIKIRPPMVFRPEHVETAVAAIGRALARL